MGYFHQSLKLNFNNEPKERTYYQTFDECIGTYEPEQIIKDVVCGQSITNIITDSNGQTLTLELSNGVKLIAKGNEGCGGCANGWFTYNPKDVITLGTDGNVITNVSVYCNFDYDKEDGYFTLNIYSLDKRLLYVNFDGCDNGYYGIGISLTVKFKEDENGNIIK